MKTIPNIFKSILAGGPVDPLVMYRRTYEGADPKDVATIAQAQEFQKILAHEIAVRNLPLPVPSVVAMEGLPGFDSEGHPSASGAAVLRTFPVSDMLKAGYPADKPTRLQFVVPSSQEEDEDGIPRGSNRMEVADTIRIWFQEENGELRVIEELGRK